MSLTSSPRALAWGRGARLGAGSSWKRRRGCGRMTADGRCGERGAARAARRDAGDLWRSQVMHVPHWSACWHARRPPCISWPSLRRSLRHPDPITRHFFTSPSIPSASSCLSPRILRLKRTTAPSSASHGPTDKKTHTRARNTTTRLPGSSRTSIFIASFRLGALQRGCFSCTLIRAKQLRGLWLQKAGVARAQSSVHALS